MCMTSALLSYMLVHSILEIKLHKGNAESSLPWCDLYIRPAIRSSTLLLRDRALEHFFLNVK